MTYVITQPCCNDASCVPVCPVNCIHPTPNDSDFGVAEMLYIDPDTCIDCGSCVDACPVDAIFPDDELAGDRERYLQINADYYTDHDVSGGSMEHKKKRTLPADTELHVAIVGAGPAAFYAAEELLRYNTIRVDMFDRLPTPYGLVRSGVAPDHLSTKGVAATFARIAAQPAFEYFLNVEVGKHVYHDELVERYGAVIYAHGASADKPLGIDGEGLTGSVSATDFVAWYNGHPDHADDMFDLSSDRVVVVGNGNVALDVARILLDDPDRLANTDIADHALAQLRESKVTEVMVMGRRGVAQAAYTNSEFLAMGDLPGVDVIIDPAELTLDPASQAARAEGTLLSTVEAKIRLAEEFARRRPVQGNRRLVLRYLLSPREIVGGGFGVQAVRCVRNRFVDSPGDSADHPGSAGRSATAAVSVESTAEEFEVGAGVVMRAVGYRGVPFDGVPFDADRGVVPNDGGRVLDSIDGHRVEGVYVAGWIKRGATGGIGMNRVCGQETADAVITDFLAAEHPAPHGDRRQITALIAQRGGGRIDGEGWKKIDAVERAAGAETGRHRVKLVRITDLESTARG